MVGDPVQLLLVNVRHILYIHTVHVHVVSGDSKVQQFDTDRYQQFWITLWWICVIGQFVNSRIVHLMTASALSLSLWASRTLRAKASGSSAANSSLILGTQYWWLLMSILQPHPHLWFKMTSNKYKTKRSDKTKTKLYKGVKRWRDFLPCYRLSCLQEAQHYLQRQWDLCSKYT